MATKRKRIDLSNEVEIVAVIRQESEHVRLLTIPEFFLTFKPEVGESYKLVKVDGEPARLLRTEQFPLYEDTDVYKFLKRRGY